MWWVFRVSGTQSWKLERHLRTRTFCLYLLQGRLSKGMPHGEKWTTRFYGSHRLMWEPWPDEMWSLGLFSFQRLCTWNNKSGFPTVHISPTLKGIHRRAQCQDLFPCVAQGEIQARFQRGPFPAIMQITQHANDSIIKPSWCLTEPFLLSFLLCYHFFFLVGCHRKRIMEGPCGRWGIGPERAVISHFRFKINKAFDAVAWTPAPCPLARGLVSFFLITRGSILHSGPGASHLNVPLDATA